jgi:hypothetical protein
LRSGDGAADHLGVDCDVEATSQIEHLGRRMRERESGKRIA